MIYFEISEIATAVSASQKNPPKKVVPTKGYPLYPIRTYVDVDVAQGGLIISQLDNHRKEVTVPQSIQTSNSIYVYLWQRTTKNFYVLRTNSLVPKDRRLNKSRKLQPECKITTHNLASESSSVTVTRLKVFRCRSVPVRRPTSASL